MLSIEYTVGDTSPAIAAFLTRKSLRGPDPGLATAVITFDLWGDVGGVETHIIADGSVVLEDEATGLCVFYPEDDSLITEGDHHRGRFTVTHIDGRIQRYPRGREYINVLIRRP